MNKLIDTKHKHILADLIFIICIAYYIGTKDAQIDQMIPQNKSSG